MHIEPRPAVKALGTGAAAAVLAATVGAIVGGTIALSSAAWLS